MCSDKFVLLQVGQANSDELSATSLCPTRKRTYASRFSVCQVESNTYVEGIVEVESTEVEAVYVSKFGTLPSYQAVAKVVPAEREAFFA